MEESSFARSGQRGSQSHLPLCSTPVARSAHSTQMAHLQTHLEAAARAAGPGPRTDSSCAGSLSRGEGGSAAQRAPQQSSDSLSESFLTRVRGGGRGREDVGGTIRKSKPLRPGSHLETMSPSSEVTCESESSKSKAEAEGPEVTRSLGLHEGIWTPTRHCQCRCR